MGRFCHREEGKGGGDPGMKKKDESVESEILVLHAGDPGRTGSDVRHLQKHALSARKAHGGSLQIVRDIAKLPF